MKDIHRERKEIDIYNNLIMSNSRLFEYSFIKNPSICFLEKCKLLLNNAAAVINADIIMLKQKEKENAST